MKQDEKEIDKCIFKTCVCGMDALPRRFLATVSCITLHSAQQESAHFVGKGKQTLCKHFVAIQPSNSGRNECFFFYQLTESKGQNIK